MFGDILFVKLEFKRVLSSRVVEGFTAESLKALHDRSDLPLEYLRPLFSAFWCGRPERLVVLCILNI